MLSADLETIHTAFLDAFSDYIVPLAPSREQLGEMLTRRGYLAEASAGVFEDGRLVAFTLNGVDGEWGYDSGTGVVQSHRRRGLARRVMEESFELLRSRGCTNYVLEVLEANAPAVALYRELGFVERRRLQCWSFAPTREVPPASEGAGVEESWWEVQPSWQNSTASLRRAHDRSVVIGDEHGYAVVFPSNGDLAQLAVRRERRREGIGTRLLEQAAAIAGKPLRILNVDARDEGIARFLERAGAVRTVRQLELVRELRPV
jgi:ribosomal protein S18 acetylase RimI-like enzyme